MSARKRGAQPGNTLQLKHGMHGSPTYATWRGMVVRCSKPSHAHWPRYGGRGIKIAPAWLTFEGFLADMGERPAGKTLDRYPDNDGDYEPGNCRWAKRTEQARNKASNVVLEWDGQRLCIADWAARIGAQPSTLGARLRKGWSIERALTEPIAPRRSRA